MEKQYRKSDLNIIEDNNELLLVYKSNELVDSFIKLSTQENILMEYSIDNLERLDRVNLTKVEKLELLYRLLNIMVNKLKRYEYKINPENIFLTVDNNIKILEKKIKIEDNTEDMLIQIKALCGYLLLKDKQYDDLIKLNNKDLENNSYLKEIYELKDLNLIKDKIEKLLKEEKINFREKKQVVNKKSYANLKKNKGLYRAFILLTIIIILIMGIYILPFKSKEINLYNSYIQSDYTTMLNVIDKMSISRMSAEEKYISTIAVIKTQSELNEKQKENISNQINVKTDVNILDYWVYIGQDNFEEANNKGISINDADMQIYALLLMIDEAQNDEDLDSQERKDLVDGYTSQIDTLNDKKEEISGENNV